MLVTDPPRHKFIFGDLLPHSTTVWLVTVRYPEHLAFGSQSSSPPFPPLCLEYLPGFPWGAPRFLNSSSPSTIIWLITVCDPSQLALDSWISSLILTSAPPKNTLHGSL